MNQADAAAADGVFEVAGGLAGVRAADRYERAELGFEYGGPLTVLTASS